MFKITTMPNSKKRNKQTVKSGTNRGKKGGARLGYSETSRNAKTLRRLEKSNHDLKEEGVPTKTIKKTVTETKTVRLFTSEEVSKRYNNLTNSKKISVLYDAIDIMQQYNGRSRFMCIALAMGFKNDEGDDVSFYIP